MFKQAFYTRNEVRNVLKNKWKLEPQKNGLAYIRYDIDYSGNFCQNNSVGRYFNISKNFILKKYVELLSWFLIQKKTNQLHIQQSSQQN